MHAVDWLPTLMSAIGHPGLTVTATDGIDQWDALTALLYNLMYVKTMLMVLLRRDYIFWRILRFCTFHVA